jgi:hypothetical protein
MLPLVSYGELLAVASAPLVYLAVKYVWHPVGRRD